MSEGKQVLMVNDPVNRLVILEQLKAYGSGIDVIVDEGQVNGIFAGLLSLPTTRDEAGKIVKSYSYLGDYSDASRVLLKNIKEEISKFAACQGKSVALRDMIFNELTRELKLPTDLGVEINVTAKDKDQGPTILLEILKELKGVKEAILPPGEDQREKALREFLSTPNLSVAGLVEGLRGYSTTFKPATVSNVLAPDTKDRFISLLTNALTDQSSESVHAALAVTRLSPADRLEIMELLNPKFSVRVVDRRDWHHTTFTPDSIFEMLVEAIKEDGLGHIQIFGLNTLCAQDREILIDKLARVSGNKQPIKVAGWKKELFIEGMTTALVEAHDKGLPIIIEGLSGQSKDSINDLVRRIKQPYSEFTLPTVDDIPQDIHGGNVAFAVSIFTNLWARAAAAKLIYIDQGGLLNHLLGQVKTLLGVEVATDSLAYQPSEIVVGSPRPKNICATLGVLSSEWADQAARYGIAIDRMILLTYLMEEQSEQLNKDSKTESGFDVLHHLLKERVATGIVVGNEVFSCTPLEDGSIKIVNRQFENSTTYLILNKDGTVALNNDAGVKLKNPGYMG